ncbi:ParB/RepB/Spo0J family partition protein [Clostridium felsineum]|uniref:Stage 0 sporulation protein J n=1 Tax=Clostridium felsineum TaxID=36839 RepID=A0A1S8LY66_9CLOT|nr:ParB/RepB/Spo0J family partition protein [Clostridium felsineum]MCR3761130.1 ParB/RepB/Spo0J family partition protein [Clostridium felsineum]URZ02786.1 Stage 0 sporulation protein J [Clostridium felsineum]URZ08888.1 Stage 0 sporulation protein J [Clostridium felsineum]URZ09516.1 Stage 0 sporulation protein J [Clostridium felsineum]
MNKKGGLGRGLNALIIDNDSNEEKNSNSQKISLNLIRPNEHQPRKNFDGDKIVQLAESIKEHGIVQPLILKKKDKQYIIVAGERRFRAAKSLGLKEVPAVIIDATEKEILEISLIENIQREDLNPIEEALAYKRLIEDFELTQEQLSQRIGKSRVAITNCMRLLNLDERVQDYLIDGVISEGHGRVLLTISDKDDQYKLSQKIIDEDLSVRATEKLLKTYKESSDKNTEKSSEENQYIVDIRDKLEGYFGTKVLLKSNKNKGKIEIEYYSNEDLQRIIDILKI